MKRVILAFALLVMLCAYAPTPASAQLVYNPTTIEFQANPTEHTNGTVARYEVRFFVQGQAAPVATADIGRPALVDTDKVRVINPALFSPLLSNIEYVARVAAIGPTNAEGVSTDSNPFRKVGQPTAPLNPVLK